METTTKKVGGERKVYPLDLSDPELQKLISRAKKKTKIKNQAALLRLGLMRGLPVLMQQLSGETATQASA